MKNIPTIACAIGLALLTSCAAPPPPSRPSYVRERALRGGRYTIDVTVELSKTITQGENRIMVELRQGVPGTSKVFDTKYFEGQTGAVSFSNMSEGSYFIAIGNGDMVAVGPVHHFNQGQRMHSTVRVSLSSGNINQRSRSSL